MRWPTPSACTSPVSSRKTPGIQPASVPLVLADERPWRTKITVGTSASVDAARDHTAYGPIGDAAAAPTAVCRVLRQRACRGLVRVVK